MSHDLPDDDDEDEEEDDLSSVFNSPVHEHASTPPSAAASAGDLLLSSSDHPPQLPSVDPIDPSVLGAIGFNVEITPPPDSAHVTCELPDVVPRSVATNASVSSDGG